MHDLNLNSDTTNISNQIKTTKIVFPQIYSYTLPEIPANAGSQKIGYTERKVDDRRRLHSSIVLYYKIW